jgi:hypothetical protein
VTEQVITLEVPEFSLQEYSPLKVKGQKFVLEFQLINLLLKKLVIKPVLPH